MVKVKNEEIHVRQDRFLATGDVKEEENQTLWYVSGFGLPPQNHRFAYRPTRYTPLTLLSTDASGKASINRNIVLDQ